MDITKNKNKKLPITATCSMEIKSAKYDSCEYQ